MRKRIILADDHAVTRAGIRKTVEEIADVEVVAEVGDGELLLAAVRRMRPDCLLVDISMPDFDPLHAIHRLRTEFPDLLILVVSAYDDEFYVQGLLAEGVNGYHLKDQPLSDLKLAVQRVLAGERWISSPLIAKLSGVPRPMRPGTLLTARQRDIVRRLQEGMDNQAIAHDMGLSVKTIENHLTRLYRQLQVQSRLEAVKVLNQHPELLGVSGAQPAARKQPPTGAVGVTIMIVDDNQRYLQQLQQVLAKVYPHATLFEATDVASAVRLAQQIRPRLVFVDVVLGEEDGIRCGRRIKAASPQSRLVMISAYPDREFHRLSMEAGAVAFLDKKDLDARTLRQVVDDVID